MRLRRRSPSSNHIDGRAFFVAMCRNSLPRIARKQSHAAHAKYRGQLLPADIVIPFSHAYADARHLAITMVVGPCSARNIWVAIYRNSAFRDCGFAGTCSVSRENSSTQRMQRTMVNGFQRTLSWLFLEGAGSAAWCLRSAVVGISAPAQHAFRSAGASISTLVPILGSLVGRMIIKKARRLGGARADRFY